jgi:two-component system chemotaxis response regulator CheB
MAKARIHIVDDSAVSRRVAQHLPPIFIGILGHRLSQASKVRACETTDGMLFEGGRAHLTVGDFHMRVSREGVCVRFEREPHKTGMGEDGPRCLQVVREAGGRIRAQDEAASVVWGIPGAVAQGGLAERVLALDLLGSAEAARRASEHLAVRPSARTTG